jgi:hypothetical protein
LLFDRNGQPKPAFDAVIQAASREVGPATVTLSGIVVDLAEGVPIPYAHIWIHEQTGKVSFATQPDSTGQFTIQLPEGYYDVLVGAPGFAPFCKKIWIKSGSPIKLKVSLEPDFEHSQAD